MHILRSGHYELVAANLVMGRYPLLIKGKWDSEGGTEYPTWKLTLTTVPGAYGKKDLEVPTDGPPQPLKDDGPEVVLYAGENYNGDKRPGGDRFIAKSQRGMAYIKWQEFCRILTASGINPKVEGDCQPKDGQTGIRSIWLDLRSKEAYGDYPAKNYAVDWSTTSDVFDVKRKAREEALLAGMAAAIEEKPARNGIDLENEVDDVGESMSRRRVVNLEDEPARGVLVPVAENPSETAQKEAKGTSKKK